MPSQMTAHIAAARCTNKRTPTGKAARSSKNPTAATALGPATGTTTVGRVALPDVMPVHRSSILVPVRSRPSRSVRH